MHYDRSYKNFPRDKADGKAIADIVEYLGTEPKGVLLFGDFVAFAVTVETDYDHPELDGKSTIHQLNMTFGLVGISGYPFHAFCRRYCLKAYRAWMSSGDDAVKTDEEGFSLAT